jgi:SiaC family regulatory phosphoprotein
MESINRVETDDCPKVLFDNAKKSLTISGNSYPENCGKIYEPIKTFIENYDVDEHNMLNFYFHFNLINSTSTVYVAQIIVKVAELANEGLSVFIKWSYDEDDEEMLDLGKKLSSISKLPIEYTSVKDED